MTTGLRPLPAGTGVDAHRHDEHQIVYAGRGVLSVTTEVGSWIAPATRAVLLDQLRHSAEQPLHVPAATDPRLVAVCALLRDDPADNRTLAQLGATAGVSDRTLTRLCRAEFGMSFPQWRTQLRLHHALRLLAEDTPVTVVAHRCGWASSSAFIDVFRRAFGHTPGAHRAQR
ncbi:AraC-type DNA-binding protein [Streptomyces sp. SceaMP-e96]|nr:AraC-type DNA-binding protein [Streptomyces sp. SceaMP-e96]